ncbi:unnamed protein product [Toxocara canis]|uniref:PDZ domain-containing protein n=1 Tax=Toxocara canis TaxID=6265 RepID=A0A183VGT2_TOXCA|nr:unnamed protein product [Toxocara canis]
MQVLHGGAAFKDGRLRINDQLIGIEDIDLRAMEKNSEASDAITKCLKAIGYGDYTETVKKRTANGLGTRRRASSTDEYS